MRRFVLRSLAGLEPIVLAELSLRLGLKGRQIGLREVGVDVPDQAAHEAGRGLIGLATVDDAFLELGSGGPVSRTRGGIDDLAEMVRGSATDDVLEALAAWRPGHRPRSLDVTASLLGDRRYSRFDVEDRIGPILSARTGLRYESHRENRRRAPSSLSYRVTLDSRRCSLLVRLAPRPLHRRPYWRGGREAALHPPLAAAIAMLADLSASHVVLDPFCGSGTIAIEAARLLRGTGLVIASDVDSEAVAATRWNACDSGGHVVALQADVSRLPCRSDCVDRMISNPPWHRQVHWLGSSPSKRSIDRVLSERFRAVLLELEPGATGIAGVRWQALASLRVSLHGQHPTITVYASEPGPATLSIGGDAQLPLDLPAGDRAGSESSYRGCGGPAC